MSAVATPPTTAPARRGRWGVVVAVAAACLAVVGLVAAATAMFLDPPPDTGRWESLWALSWVGMPVVGGLVCVRRPGNRVGWSLLAAGTGIGTGLGASAALTLVGGDASAVLRALLVVPEAVGFSVGYGSLVLLLLHFPSGRVEAAALARVPGLVLLLMAIVATATTLQPREDAFSPDVANPLAILPADSWAGTVETVAALGVIACGALALGYTVVRTRRAVGIERLQRRWFNASAAVGLALFLAGVVADAVVSPDAANPFIYGGFLVGLSGSSAAIGVAVLRYRLFDIDRLVSRTGTYAVVTAVLVGLYAVVAVVPATLFSLRSDLLVAVATLVVAAAFGPVRRRVQRRVDRRFDRARYDAARVADGFAARLRDRVEFGEVGADLQAVVAATVQPEHVSLWLAEGRGVRA